MDRLDAMTLFTRIVESGSFTHAANALNLPRATATLAIQQLEARLGVRLLERTTRQVRPTPEGSLYYERCLALLDELETTEAMLAPGASDPRGTVRVEIHGTHARHLVLPRLAGFHARYPNLDVVITTGDRHVDLIAEGIDCAVRSGIPADSSLVARHLTTLEQTICASPDYLTRMGNPTGPDALADHYVVGFVSGHRAPDTTLDLIVDGQLRRVSAGSWLTVNDVESYLVGAIAGYGLIQLPRLRLEDELAEGRLVEVLATWEKPALPVNVVYPQRRHLSPRVRVFIDWLQAIYAERFGA